MALTEVQQQLLSYFNLTKVSSLTTTLKVFEEILNHLRLETPSTEAQLLEEVSGIRRTITDYDLEIVESIDEITCEKIFIIINTADNFATQMSKFYDANTYNFFCKIIKECLLSEKGHISETECLNISSELKIKKTVAESIVNVLIKDKWLVSQNGTISLGMRSIVELEQNLKQLYPNDIKHCPFCKLIVVQGFICDNCNLRCHNACWKKYINSKSGKTCPTCKQNWDNMAST